MCWGCRARFEQTLPYGFDPRFTGEFLVVDVGDFDVDVDTVEQGAAVAFLVAGDGYRGATTFFDRVTIVATGAPV